jgi:hypothetical protein
MSVAMVEYGLIAEFAGPDRLVEATRRAYLAGYRQMDAFAPYQVEDLPEALGVRPSSIPLIVLAGGAVGAASGYALQWWVSAVAYPMNVAGKPYNSWPMFIPVIFELTVLFACLAGFFGMLIQNGLPRPHHPVFNVASFRRASQDGFFLLIEASDPRYDREATRRFLHGAGATEVSDVPEL